MDWSLVLVSQGIETFIEEAPEGVGWSLLVAPEDHARATDAIQQYQHENRHWLWRKAILKHGVVFDWGSLAWVLLLGLFFWLSETWIDLRQPGIMDSAALNHGQWWRLFTATWLHGDLSHFVGNATLGLVLLGLAMGRYGTGIGLLAAYLTGAGGNIVAWGLSLVPHRSLGASGIVMGCLGLLAIQPFSRGWFSRQQTKYAVSAITAAVFLFILLGLSPGSDVLAHAGGFASGLLLGALLGRTQATARKQFANLLCGFLFTALTVGPWYFALWHNHGRAD
jgi:membrane associated rhomboid family serine protease